MIDHETNINRAVSVGNYLNLYLGQDQGVRLGESCIVSRKAHARMPEKRVKGQIKILRNRDAGKSYLNYVEADKIVHIDIYHQPGEIDTFSVAQEIFAALEKYIIDKEPQLKYAEESLYKLLTGYAEKINITTNKGKGTLIDIIQGFVKPYTEGEEGWDHVHLLVNLSSEEYYLVYVIADAVEKVIINCGVKLSRVRNIVHGNEKQKVDDFSGYIKLPWRRLKGQSSWLLPEKENVNHLIIKMAEKFGGVEEIEEFLDSYSTNFFKRKGMENQKKKWGDVEDYIDQLEKLGLIKNTVLGKVLTGTGNQLKQFLLTHKCELETEIRRNMRKMPSGGSSRFKRLGTTEQKPSVLQFTNYNKTFNKFRDWTGDLAIPETVIQARKNSYLRNEPRILIDKDSLHYYKKKNYVPIDVCLLIDASGSMAGDKRQAACFLAQNLLLNGKEKVAVVTFQERNSSIVVPFTRNQAVLNKGLSSINPAGFTPMADGIMTAVYHIKNSRVRNPLLVMITDGIPNIPLWSLDAKSDGLEAASIIKQNKIRFICIGVESNRFYLEKVAEAAGGTLYLVDDLNCDNLISIVRHEKKIITGHKKKMA